MSAELEEWAHTHPKKRKKWPWVLAAAVLLLLLAALAAFLVVRHRNEYALDLTVQGESRITLEYGSAFEDPGASASFRGTLLHREPEQVPVTVTGAVDTAVLGEYGLTYRAEYSLDDLTGKETFSAEHTRTVCIVDTQAPTITLISDPEGYTIPGEDYVEEGFTAADGYDGDLTDRVERTEDGGVVTYTVRDSSGNTATVERAIVYHDPTPPVLTLKGSAWASLYQGNSYSDAGCTAWDNCDGDLTDAITVSGSVDTAKAGTYTLTYTVTDSYNNTASVQRTVTVKELPAIPELPGGDYSEPVNPSGKVIYLTFDDGPSAHTSRLLDVLAKYDVKATFFVCETAYLDDLLPRMAAEGHTIAMHSASHVYSKIYASEGAYFTDLKRIQDLITKYTGQTPTMLRFPGGSSNTVSRFNPGIMTRLTNAVDDMGYRYFDWNVSSGDAGALKSVTYADQVSEVYSNVVNGIRGRSVSVVLQHDSRGCSVDAVENIIKWGHANGYTFLPLDTTSPICEHKVNN